MPEYGNYKREITTIKDLKYLLNELTEVHQLNDDCKIEFVTSNPFDPQDIKVFASGDISYSENEADIHVEIREGW